MILEVIQGCPALNCHKGMRFELAGLKHQGHGMYQVSLFSDQLRICLYGQHVQNHLDRGDEFNLNNGNPLKKIRLQQVRS